jgi:hypothetical protein
LRLPPFQFYSDITMTNLQNLKPFVKGDVRINRKGRIDNFAKFRKLAQKIGNEPLTESEEIIFSDLLRKLAKSRNPADKALFLAYAVGKPKDEVDVTSAGEKIELIVKYATDNKSTPTTPKTD